MYLFFTGASLKIARDLIRTTGIGEYWGPLLEKSKWHGGKGKLLTEILGLNACNLAQTMKETSVDKEIDAEDRQDLLDDYIMENLRLQNWVALRDGSERMGKWQEILVVWERLRPHFNRTREAQGFKPRLEAVRDVMRHLGTGANVPFEEALLEFVESQHRLFKGYIMALLEPFSVEDLPAEPEPPVEPQRPAASVGLEALGEMGRPAKTSAPVEPPAPVESPAPVEIPLAERTPPLEAGREEPLPEPEEFPRRDPVVPETDPTQRLSRPPGTEDSPLVEGSEPEEESTHPEPPAESLPAVEAGMGGPAPSRSGVPEGACGGKGSPAFPRKNVRNRKALSHGSPGVATDG